MPAEVAERPTRRRRSKRHQARKDMVAEALAHPSSQWDGKAVDHISALQETLHYRLGEFRLAQAQVAKLKPEEFWRDTMAGRYPHEWIIYLRDSATRLEDACATIERLGLSRRMVEVEEARAVLVVQAVRDAAREAGIPDKMVKALGSALRAKLERGEIPEDL